MGMLYNACLDNDNKIFNSAQNITIQSSEAISPEKMAWPLIPQTDYKAPLSQASSSTGSGAQGLPNIPPQMLQQLGINPQVMNFLDASGIPEGQIDPEQLIKAGIKLYMSGACKDGCVVQ